MKDIEEFGAGSQKDLELLYDKYSPAMYGVITTIISDKSKAEEVLIRVFSVLAAEIENYQHKHSLLLWLLNLSRNHSIAQLIEDNATTKAALANSYISSLPLLEKTIFALVYLKGLNIHEVAAILHLPLIKIENVFNGLPNFTPYMFANIKRKSSPVTDMLQALTQNIIPVNDHQRIAALKKLGILYTPAEEAFDKITQMAARVFDTPMSFLSLVDEDTVFYKSQVGPFGRSQVNRENSLCSLTILSKEPLVIEDASLATCFRDNPFVQAEKGIKFYAGAPLITKEGYLIGALCVVDTKPRAFSFNDTVLLTEFAETAMQEIESRHETFQHILLQEQVASAANKNKAKF